MDDKVAKIVNMIGEWYAMYIGLTPMATRKKFGDDIYNTLVINGKIDMYKYCGILYNFKYSKSKSIEKFLEKYDISLYSPGLMNGYIMQFYKDKFCDINDGNIYSRYSKHLFGCPIHEIDWNKLENLNEEKIEFILNHIRKYGIALTMNGMVDKFILECKKVNYNSYSIIDVLGINMEYYNKITQESYEFSLFEYADFLEYKQLKKDVVACVEYIKALNNTCIDLQTNEVTVSLESIQTLMENANFEKYKN